MKLIERVQSVGAWAQAVRLPREEMMNLVERQGAEHVEPADG